MKWCYNQYFKKHYNIIRSRNITLTCTITCLFVVVKGLAMCAAHLEYVKSDDDDTKEYC